MILRKSENTDSFELEIDWLASVWYEFWLKGIFERTFVKLKKRATILEILFSSWNI